MKVPDEIYQRLREKLWTCADEKKWPSLSDQQKSVLYEEWLKDEQVGGTLSRYLDAGSVRVYLKDTLMKPFGSDRIKDFALVSKLLDLQGETVVAKSYTKPHGRRLSDGRVVSWGKSRDWKQVLFATFERAHLHKGARPFAAVIMFPVGKFQQPTYRGMVEAASQRLGVERLIWYEG